MLQQVQGWRGLGGRGWAVRSDEATRRTFRAAAMSMFSSVSKGQISKEGWKSCSLSRHLGEEPQLTGGCPTGSPVPPVPVAEPTSAAVPGGVPLCCWWQGSSPGAGAATAARTRRRQRSCQPDSPPEGTGTFSADQAGPPHGRGQVVKALPGGSSLQPNRPPPGLSNLSFHSAPWRHGRPQGVCTTHSAAPTASVTHQLICTTSLHHISISVLHTTCSLLHHEVCLFSIPYCPWGPCTPRRLGPSLPAPAQAGPHHSLQEQHFQALWRSPPAPGATRPPPPSALACPPAAPAGSCSPGCGSDGDGC